MATKILWSRPVPGRTRIPASHTTRRSGLAHLLCDQGLHPYTLPTGVGVGGDGGSCGRASAMDSRAPSIRSRMLTTMCSASATKPERRDPNQRLRRTVDHRPSGRRVESAEVRINGELCRAAADKFVLSAGAVNSAALLLRSTNGSHPNGLANSSDQVGRNYIQHRDSALSGVDPSRPNHAEFQKTLGVNDFYLSPDGDHPRLGTLQTTGKVLGRHIKGQLPWMPARAAEYVAAHSLDWWLMTEDCPLPQNRVVLARKGGIRLEWRPTSVRRHRKLLRASYKMMRRAGYPVIVWSHFGIDVNAHQASTLRMGVDPQRSVVNPLCRAHDVENLYVVDASILPSLGAGPGGPTLTVAALALRMASESGVIAMPLQAAAASLQPLREAP